MRKIATHNSATGEAGRNFLYCLLKPFAQCQRLTLRQQHAYGCRLFDLRVRFDKRGDAYFCHGLWRGRRDGVYRALCSLDEMAEGVPQKTYIMLTYEGHLENENDIAEFGCLQTFVTKFCKNLTLLQTAEKKPTWRVLYANPDAPAMEQCYEKLVWPNKRMLLPVPRLWAWVRGREEFNTDTFKMVDFL